MCPLKYGRGLTLSLHLLFKHSTTPFITAVFRLCSGRKIIKNPFFSFHILCIYATRWVMTDLLLNLNVHILAWPEALYFVTISALSRRKIVRDLWVSPPEFLSIFPDESESWFSPFRSSFLCHSSSLSLAPSLLPTSVPSRNFNTGPTARSFANNLPSHLLSGRCCQLIPS